MWTLIQQQGGAHSKFAIQIEKEYNTDIDTYTDIATSAVDTDKYSVFQNDKVLQIFNIEEITQETFTDDVLSLLNNENYSIFTHKDNKWVTIQHNDHEQHHADLTKHLETMYESLQIIKTYVPN